MRVVGSGNLKLKFQSLDEVEEEVMAELPLSSPNSRESFRLANMTTFRAALRIEVDEINEWFKIGSLVIYVKKVASEFPA